MKKALLSFAAAICCMGVANAQHMAPASAKSFENPKTAGKTTGTDSRLVGATSSWWDNGAMALQDSGYATYPGTDGYGYDAEHDEWKFANAVNGDYDGINFTPSYRTTNTFNSNKRFSTVLSEMFDNGNWVLDDYSEYTYTAGNKLATEMYAYFNGSDWDSSLTTNTYNTQGNLIAAEEMRYTQAGGWEKVMKQTMTYDASGNQTNLLMEGWNTNSQQYEPQMRQTFTYVNGKNTESINESYNNGAWTNSYRTVNTYDANGRLSQYETFNYNNGSWEPSYRYNNTYDANGNVVSSVSENYIMGSYVKNRETVSTYNSFQQVVTEVSKVWDGSQFVIGVGSSASTYYYETFTNSVKDVAKNNDMLRAYPVPAGNTLQLNLHRAVAEAASGFVFDATGRVVAQFAVPATKQHTQQVDVSALPSGNYTIKVTGANTKLSQQVVVSH